MEWYDKVLDKLDKVKPRGELKWSACCPVHDDNNPSMNIAVIDHKLLMYCFACGAKGDSVIESIGLTSRDLFEPGHHDTNVYTTKYDNAYWQLKRTQEADDWRIALHEVALETGGRITHKEHQAYVEALARRKNRAAQGIHQVVLQNHKQDFI